MSCVSEPRNLWKFILIKRNLFSGLSVPFGLVAASMIFAGTAGATEGYFQHGVGARHKALAGAGVADANDATAIAINPAGLVKAGHSLDVAVSLFAPDRGYTGTGQGFTPSGSFNANDSEVFLLPDIAYARPFGEKGAIGIALNANGGMNTNYAAVPNPACAQPGMPASSGIFCGGSLGVDLMQAFITIGYAHDFGSFSVGVAPVFAIQSFEARGIAAFAGVSADPANVSDNGHDISTGFGLRLGAEWDVTDNFRVGATYQTEYNMSEFDDYAGLFADRGDFDIPASLQVGVAYDVSEQLTVMLDYRHMAYSDIGSVGNAGTVQAPLGAPGGPGFGWQDVEAWKLGVEYEAENGWTWRAGMATNNNPINAQNVTFNILAPGVVTQHFTAGFEKQVGENQSFQFAVMYAPEETVSGIEVTPFGANPFQNIELRMDQLELTAGWTWKFGN